ncbi:hypothetical protein [Dokdonia sp.]|uniref:hypothetical protein n=1 Tax=Dokdonia sp. TaxID=2024995 RepID=UPI003265F25A
MNSILDIIQTRKLYEFLILYIVYINTKGQTNYNYNNAERDIEELLMDEFDNEFYLVAENYLFTEGYVQSYAASSLTPSGRNHFENWIEDFSRISDEEKQTLSNNLSERVKKFLKLSNEGISLIKNAVDLLKLINQN